MVVVVALVLTNTAQCGGGVPPNSYAIDGGGKPTMLDAVVSTARTVSRRANPSRSSVSVNDATPSVPHVPLADAGQVGVSFNAPMI